MTCWIDEVLDGAGIKSHAFMWGTFLTARSDSLPQGPSIVYGHHHHETLSIQCTHYIIHVLVLLISLNLDKNSM